VEVIVRSYRDLGIAVVAKRCRAEALFRIVLDPAFIHLLQLGRPEFDNRLTSVLVRDRIVQSVSTVPLAGYDDVDSSQPVLMRNQLASGRILASRALRQRPLLPACRS